jgi:hypothetical protein
MLPIRIEHHWRDIAASIPQLPCACWFVKQEREIEYFSRQSQPEPSNQMSQTFS